ncbi:hypothetical protein [Bordetella sp. FB-8]|uniref:hypothetical protein n=1 Tax=Bordetella sp. FB-8 TaxID=1159870 RepID=UPI000362F561|nr:hypothetical protein [Bordetella sp. FB-8]
MADAELKEQILKSVYRRIAHLPNRNASAWEIRAEFDHVDKDTFFDALIEMVSEKTLFDRGHGYVALTPDGRDKADRLVNPPPTFNHNTLNIGQAVNSPVQQGIHAHQTQTTTYTGPSTDELQQLVDLMKAHLAELQLPALDERKAKAQLATIEAQLLDEPNPSIVKEAGHTLRNITEGTIAGLLANAAPSVWPIVHGLLAQF